MSVYNENDVLNALRLVPAPYLEMDVVSAGLLKEITINGPDVSFTLEHKIPGKQIHERLEAEIREALRKHIPGLGAVDMLQGVNIPGQDSPQKSAILPGVRNTIAIASGKGGVGKSTVAVNLAVALAQNGARVGLIDGDIYGPSLPLMMGIQEQPRAYQEDGKTRLLPCEKFGVKVMSIGFLVDADSAVIWRGPMASGALKQFLTDVDWGELDYLIFDLPPGTGDIQLTLSQTLPLNGVVIVTTPQDVSLADARKGVRMFEKVSVPILGIVENMSYYICTHCGERDNIFSTGGGLAAANEMNVGFLGEIPLLTRVREGGDVGTPIVMLEPESEIAATFSTVSLSLAGQIARRNMTSSVPKINISL